jgi:hypothetical protein
LIMVSGSTPKSSAMRPCCSDCWEARYSIANFSVSNEYCKLNRLFRSKGKSIYVRIYASAPPFFLK